MSFELSEVWGTLEPDLDTNEDVPDTSPTSSPSVSARVTGDKDSGSEGTVSTEQDAMHQEILQRMSAGFVVVMFIITFLVLQMERMNNHICRLEDVLRRRIR